MKQGDISRMFDEPLTSVAVIAILANDLPQMTEAQLAELLTNFFLDGPSAVADAIAPLARQELSRRRFIAQVESILAAA
jgi:hypothetical protein